MNLEKNKIIAFWAVVAGIQEEVLHSPVVVVHIPAVVEGSLEHIQVEERCNQVEERIAVEVGNRPAVVGIRLVEGDIRLVAEVEVEVVVELGLADQEEELQLVGDPGAKVGR